MVRQDRDAQPVDRGAAHGRHILASHTGFDANDMLAAILRLKMPFEIVGGIMGREGG